MRKIAWGIFGLFGLAGATMLSAPYWLSPSVTARIANHFLPQGYRLQPSSHWELGLRGLSLPVLTIQSPDCSMAKLQDIHLHWWPSLQLDIQQSNLDYACLQPLLTHSGDSSHADLATIFALVPKMAIHLAHFRLDSLKTPNNPLLAQLLQSDSTIHADYDGERLQLTHQAQDNERVILRQHAQLVRQKGHFNWQSQSDYQPLDGHTYHFSLVSHIPNQLAVWPDVGKFELTWDNPDWTVTQGHLNFHWDGEKGQLNAQDVLRNQPLLDVPMTFNPQGLEITWGKFYWTFDGYQPLKGFLGIALRKPAEGFWPLRSDLNVILQTFGEQGKGEIVISSQNGEIGGGKALDELDFDLNTRGDLRYNNNVAFTNLHYRIVGHFADPLLHFLPGSIFKMDHLSDDSKIHVRLPLDDVLVGRYGLEGRLQASLQGFTPQFRDLDLQLDGQAHEFIAGIKTIFELRDERHKLRDAEMQAANRWDWQINGKAHWQALDTPLTMQGKGFWEGDHIELNKLTAQSGKVEIDGVKMAPLSLQLRDRLRWDYQEEHLRGLLQAKTDWIEFAYGGRFVKPIFGLGVDGLNIDDFSLAGDLHADRLGPLQVQAYYQKNRLSGNIGWPQQSAKVLQTLFPQHWEWLIRDGQIKGNGKFSIDSEGVSLDGELHLQRGQIELPDGTIDGLNIHFPLHYRNFDLHAEARQPIRVSAQSLRWGALQVEQAALDVSGHYPNSASKPLTLSKVRLGLFDGQLTVPRLDFPQRQQALLTLNNIDIAQVLALAQYQQLSLTGRVNARLPFWLGNRQCLICQGEIEQATPLHLRLNEQVTAGLKTGGWTETTLVDLLKELNLQTSRAVFDLQPNGEMLLNAHIQGYNPQNPTHHPITLNYHHRENMFELWDMIDYGSQFEQNLQYRLYRNLEK